MRSPHSFSDLEEAVQKGKIEEVREKLLGTSLKGLSRTSLGAIAALARRVGVPSLSLRILGPWVRPRNGLPSSATEDETALYAGSLIRIGAVEEAEQLLGQLRETRCPAYFFFMAHLHMGRWDYRSAIPLLRTYLTFPSLSAYDRLMGELNLAAAIVYEREEPESGELLQHLRAESAAHGFVPIRASALELTAQRAIELERWPEADLALEESSRLHADQPNIEAFFIKKWRHFMKFRREGLGPENADALATFRSEAEGKGHWETVRDCDFLRAVLNRDRELLVHLHYGTPFEEFRRRLFLRFGEQIDIPPAYLLRSATPSETTRWLDLRADSGSAKPGVHRAETPLSRRLLEALASDFYRPATPGSLYSLLFPGEHLNPGSFSNRIFRAVSQLRKELEENGTGIAVLSGEYGYRMKVEDNAGVLIPRNFHRPAVSPLEGIRDKLPDPCFSASDVAALLGLDRNQIRSLIRKSLGDGSLIAEGSGRATVYRFSNPGRKAA